MSIERNEPSAFLCVIAALVQFYPFYLVWVRQGALTVASVVLNDSDLDRWIGVCDYCRPYGT